MQNQTRQQRRAAERARTKNSPWSGILSASQAAAARKAGTEPTKASSAPDFGRSPRRRGGLAPFLAAAAIIGGSLAT